MDVHGTKGSLPIVLVCETGSSVNCFALNVRGKGMEDMSMRRLRRVISSAANLSDDYDVVIAGIPNAIDITNSSISKAGVVPHTRLLVMPIIDSVRVPVRGPVPRTLINRQIRLIRAELTRIQRLYAANDTPVTSFPPHELPPALAHSPEETQHVARSLAAARIALTEHLAPMDSRCGAVPRGSVANGLPSRMRSGSRALSAVRTRPTPVFKSPHAPTPFDDTTRALALASPHPHTRHITDITHAVAVDDVPLATGGGAWPWPRGMPRHVPPSSPRKPAPVPAVQTPLMHASASYGLTPGPPRAATVVRSETNVFPTAATTRGREAIHRATTGGVRHHSATAPSAHGLTHAVRPSAPHPRSASALTRAARGSSATARSAASFATPAGAARGDGGGGGGGGATPAARGDGRAASMASDAASDASGVRLHAPIGARRAGLGASVPRGATPQPHTRSLRSQSKSNTSISAADIGRDATPLTPPGALSAHSASPPVPSRHSPRRSPLAAATAAAVGVFRSEGAEAADSAPRTRGTLIAGVADVVTPRQEPAVATSGGPLPSPPPPSVVVVGIGGSAPTPPRESLGPAAVAAMAAATTVLGASSREDSSCARGVMPLVMTDAAAPPLAPDKSPLVDSCGRQPRTDARAVAPAQRPSMDESLEPPPASRAVVTAGGPTAAAATATHAPHIRTPSAALGLPSSRAARAPVRLAAATGGTGPRRSALRAASARPVSRCAGAATTAVIGPPQPRTASASRAAPTGPHRTAPELRPFALRGAHTAVFDGPAVRTGGRSGSVVHELRHLATYARSVPSHVGTVVRATMRAPSTAMTRVQPCRAPSRSVASTPVPAPAVACKAEEPPSAGSPRVAPVTVVTVAATRQDDLAALLWSWGAKPSTFCGAAQVEAAASDSLPTGSPANGAIAGPASLSGPPHHVAPATLVEGADAVPPSVSAITATRSATCDSLSAKAPAAAVASRGGTLTASEASLEQGHGLMAAWWTDAHPPAVVDSQGVIASDSATDPAPAGDLGEPAVSGPVEVLDTTFPYFGNPRRIACSGWSPPADPPGDVILPANIADVACHSARLPPAAHRDAVRTSPGHRPSPIAPTPPRSVHAAQKACAFGAAPLDPPRPAAAVGTYNFDRTSASPAFHSRGRHDSDSIVDGSMSATWGISSDQFSPARTPMIPHIGGYVPPASPRTAICGSPLVADAIVTADAVLSEWDSKYQAVVGHPSIDAAISAANAARAADTTASAAAAAAAAAATAVASGAPTHAAAAAAAAAVDAVTEFMSHRSNLRISIDSPGGGQTFSSLMQSDPQRAMSGTALPASRSPSRHLDPRLIASGTLAMLAVTSSAACGETLSRLRVSDMAPASPSPHLPPTLTAGSISARAPLTFYPLDSLVVATALDPAFTSMATGGARPVPIIATPLPSFADSRTPRRSHSPFIPGAVDRLHASVPMAGDVLWATPPQPAHGPLNDLTDVSRGHMASPASTMMGSTVAIQRGTPCEAGGVVPPVWAAPLLRRPGRGPDFWQPDTQAGVASGVTTPTTASPAGTAPPPAGCSDDDLSCPLSNRAGLPVARMSTPRADPVRGIVGAQFPVSREGADLVELRISEDLGDDVASHSGAYHATSGSGRVYLPAVYGHPASHGDEPLSHESYWGVVPLSDAVPHVPHAPPPHVQAPGGAAVSFAAPRAACLGAKWTGCAVSCLRSSSPLAAETVVVSVAQAGQRAWECGTEEYRATGGREASHEGRAYTAPTGAGGRADVPSRLQRVYAIDLGEMPHGALPSSDEVIDPIPYDQLPASPPSRAADGVDPPPHSNDRVSNGNPYLDPSTALLVIHRAPQDDDEGNDELPTADPPSHMIYSTEEQASLDRAT